MRESVKITIGLIFDDPFGWVMAGNGNLSHAQSGIMVNTYQGILIRIEKPLSVEVGFWEGRRLMAAINLLIDLQFAAKVRANINKKEST